MAYTTTSDVQYKLKATLTSDQQNYFDNVVDPFVDAYINRFTETQFGSVAATTVYVSGDGGSNLIIPTMHTITQVDKVENDGTTETVASSDYYTYPRGATNVYAIRKINGSWSDGFENYKISGVLGHSGIPNDIVGVATEIAVNMIQENINNYKSEKVGDWSVTYAEVEKDLTPASMKILSSYKRLSRGI